MLIILFILIIWIILIFRFASITINLGPTFLSGALAANLDDHVHEPSCPIVQVSKLMMIMKINEMELIMRMNMSGALAANLDDLMTMSMNPLAMNRSG